MLELNEIKEESSPAFQWVSVYAGYHATDYPNIAPVIAVTNIYWAFTLSGTTPKTAVSTITAPLPPPLPILYVRNVRFLEIHFSFAHTAAKW